MLKEFVLEHKEDVWTLPEDTRILRVNCKLNHNAAMQIIERCRELEEIIFEANAHGLTEEGTKKYLNDWVLVSIEGEHRKHKVTQEEADEIRELYARGDHHLDTLSRQFELPKRVVWRIIKEKAHG